MGTKKCIVIGSGFAGLAAAIQLADAGYEVTVLEKNSEPGGRARQFEEQGFVFDMGPSWYWMPDVFDAFFHKFGKKVSDYYDLIRLDPSYKVVFGPGDEVELPASLEELYSIFDSIEPGSSQALKKFLKEAQYKYEVGMRDYVVKPSHSILEFADLRILSSMTKMQLFSNMASHLRSHFKHPKLLKLLEFPVLFLGATPAKTPALYSLMNYADIALGTWYPMGGMHKIVEAMVSLAIEKGVQIKCNQAVVSVDVSGRMVKSVKTKNTTYVCDVVVGAADYHHIEQTLIPETHRQYTETYWDKRVMAPSSLLFYLGVNKRLKNLLHHNLFFDEDFSQHAHEIYEDPQWPSKPLFYVCAPSVTDESVAPEGSENIFILIPLAAGLADDETQREKYYHIVMDRLEKLTGQEIRQHIVYKRGFAMQDFQSEYNSFKGNAYGLANTLLQTAFLKPKMRNKHLDNLYYAGQLTTPGPGVPPSLISGQVAAGEIIKEFGKGTHQKQHHIVSK